MCQNDFVREESYMADRITLKQALECIQQLEKENADLREELEYYKKRKASGRQKHNAKWMTIYNDFVICYEKGMSLIEIAERNNISKRTVYRYKEYYDSSTKQKKG